MPVIFRAVEELNMLTATVHWHIRVYTYIYMHISTDVFCMYVCRMMYISMSYIVCMCDVYCTYLHVYTYINVFFVRKVVRRIDTYIYIQYTCIRTIYVHYTELYTWVYVKIHTIYVHFFWEPDQNHHFSPCTYMHVYAVYSCINDRYVLRITIRTE
jgi:hypothetical protein